jgi:hypothetical protein
MVSGPGGFNGGNTPGAVPPKIGSSTGGAVNSSSGEKAANDQIKATPDEISSSQKVLDRQAGAGQLIMKTYDQHEKLEKAHEHQGAIGRVVESADNGLNYHNSYNNVDKRIIKSETEAQDLVYQTPEGGDKFNEGYKKVSGLQYDPNKPVRDDKTKWGGEIADNDKSIKGYEKNQKNGIGAFGWFLLPGGCITNNATTHAWEDNTRADGTHDFKAGDYFKDLGIAAAAAVPLAGAGAIGRAAGMAGKGTSEVVDTAEKGASEAATSTAGKGASEAAADTAGRGTSEAASSTGESTAGAASRSTSGEGSALSRGTMRPQPTSGEGSALSRGTMRPQPTSGEGSALSRGTMRGQPPSNNLSVADKMKNAWNRFLPPAKNTQGEGSWLSQALHPQPTSGEGSALSRGTMRGQPPSNNLSVADKMKNAWNRFLPPAKNTQGEGSWLSQALHPQPTSGEGSALSRGTMRGSQPPSNNLSVADKMKNGWNRFFSPAKNTSGEGSALERGTMRGQPTSGEGSALSRGTMRGSQPPSNNLSVADKMKNGWNRFFPPAKNTSGEGSALARGTLRPEPPVENPSGEGSALSRGTLRGGQRPPTDPVTRPPARPVSPDNIYDVTPPRSSSPVRPNSGAENPGRVSRFTEGEGNTGDAAKSQLETNPGADVTSPFSAGEAPANPSPIEQGASNTGRAARETGREGSMLSRGTLRRQPPSDLGRASAGDVSPIDNPNSPIDTTFLPSPI